MSDSSDTPEAIIWQHVDRPIVVVDADSNIISNSNSAARSFYRLSHDTHNAKWPDLLHVLHLPDTIEPSVYATSRASKDNQKKYRATLEYTDTETGVGMHFVFEYVFMASEGQNDKWAIICIDQTQAFQALQERSDFVTLASHQLRTPLTAVSWSLEYLQKKYQNSFSEEQLKLVERAYKGSRAMSELVSALLQVTKVETGTLKLAPYWVEVKQLLEEVVSALENEAEQKDIHIVTSFHTSLPKIILDGSLIKYLFTNLISNAIKYSHKGSDVTIFLSHLDDKLLVQVDDSGIGIPKESQNNIFNKFYRAPNAMKHAPDGTGLGLYLCKVIAKKSHGDIWFESNENSGTTFWFKLPLTDNKKGEHDG